MPAQPASRPLRLTLAVGTNVIFDHLGYRRPTFAEQTRQHVTVADVEHYLATPPITPTGGFRWDSGYPADGVDHTLSTLIFNRVLNAARYSSPIPMLMA